MPTVREDVKETMEDPTIGSQGSAPRWMLDDLVAEGMAALERGDFGDARVIDGRVLSVKASPMMGNSEHIVVGVAVLPAGFSTRAHSHSAEEVAVILRGNGSVDIDGIPHQIGPGTILLTPSNRVHVTHSEGGDPLVILWFYAPPGSEARWIEPEKHRTDGHAS